MISIGCYQSDKELSEVDLDDVLSDFSVRTRNRGVEYKFSATFESEKDVTIDGFWKKHVSHTTETGFKQFFLL